MSIYYRLTIVLLLLCITSCGGSGGGSSVTTVTDTNNTAACTEREAKIKLLDTLREWYLWNDVAAVTDNFAQINIDDYTDIYSLIAALRYRPDIYDRGFSYITTPSDEETYLSDAQYVGYGFGLAQASNGDIVVSQVFSDGPAAEAELLRGYRIAAIDGRDMSIILANEGLSVALDSNVEGATHTFTFVDSSGVLVGDIDLTSRIVTIDVVGPSVVLPSAMNGEDVGYLMFRSFIGSADAQLRSAFAEFKNAGIKHIVVDLRYNGGGIVDTAVVLGSLLGGPALQGNIFVEFSFNSDKAGENWRENFQYEVNSIDFDSVSFITSKNTASASELLINGLQPYFENAGKYLSIIGTPTYGKPVGQAGFDICDAQYRVRPVTFFVDNVLGEGDYFTGLPVDCTAYDDYSTPFGDTSDPLLNTALTHMASGTCPTVPIAQRALPLLGGVDAIATASQGIPARVYSAAF